MFLGCNLRKRLLLEAAAGLPRSPVLGSLTRPRTPACAPRRVPGPRPASTRSERAQVSECVSPSGVVAGLCHGAVRGAAPVGRRGAVVLGVVLPGGPRVQVGAPHPGCSSTRLTPGEAAGTAHSRSPAPAGSAVPSPGQLRIPRQVFRSIESQRPTTAQSTAWLVALRDARGGPGEPAD